MIIGKIIMIMVNVFRFYLIFRLHLLSSWCKFRSWFNVHQ
jgi:hypothetical protein